MGNLQRHLEAPPHPLWYRFHCWNYSGELRHIPCDALHPRVYSTHHLSVGTLEYEQVSRENQQRHGLDEILGMP